MFKLLATDPGSWSIIGWSILIAAVGYGLLFVADLIFRTKSDRR
jgi:hypothetical protein